MNELRTPPQELAEILLKTGDADSNGPVIGTETEALPKPQTGGDILVEEARSIVGRCVRQRNEPASRIGLVTGYVQSGKTWSFTTVCAIARDNGFPLIIVITGTKTNLFDQANERLERDLRLKTRTDRKWLHIPIDIKGQSPQARIQDTLADWNDPRMPDSRRQAVLITVMKHYRHLPFLTRALSSLDLANVPTLVIDDECDQASLNTLVSRGRESATYRHLLLLRDALPVHTYVQYTATPQAPLLINLIDALSPEFAEVLTPGPSYTGGAIFFAPASPLIHTIPASEIFSSTQRLTAPPQSYQAALATFYVGVAAGNLREQGVGNRSMMVHPHQSTQLHSEYFVWAETMKQEWARALTAAPGDEFRDHVEQLISEAHADLRRTVEDLPAKADILAELPTSIRKTQIWEVNSAEGPTPNMRAAWRNSYSHILVGGQAIDRGFTVEGLTVSYMPRGLGERNADTVQQRARFFGYKESYLGYCRVWLEQGVRDAYESYVEHEEDMRNRLIAHRATGRSLKEWKRAFFLDAALRPTRQQVLGVPYMRGNHGARWVDPQRPHELRETIEHNNHLLNVFANSLAMSEDDGHTERTVHQRHRVAHGLPLHETYAVLQDLRLPDPQDSLEHTAMLLQIDAWLEKHPDATCSVYVMRPGALSRRTLTVDDKLGNFYQGANPSTGPLQGSIYPGDQKIRHERDLTIQIHTFDLDPHADAPDPSRYAGVRIAAIFVPGAMGKDWLSQ